MIFYFKTKTGNFGINLDNMIDFLYDNATKRLTINYVAGKSYVTTDLEYIKAFLNMVGTMEGKGMATGVSID